MTAAIGSFESMNWKAQFLYRLGFECSDAIDTLYSDVPTRFSSYETKFKVSPCSFTDYSRYQPADEKKKWIVFAGRLEWFKNPELFVDAASLAADTLRNLGWTCLLYGDGELRSDVEDRISARNLSDLLQINQSADLSPVLNQSMIFTSLQQTENYPSQVLLEAMAAGNAIIATDVGETRRIVDEEVGLLLNESTPEALAQAMTTLARDSELRERLASRARTRILDQHTVAKFAAFMEDFWADTHRQGSSVQRPSWARVVSLFAQGAVGLKF